MKRSTLLMIAILVALIGLFTAARNALAVDPPHNSNNSLGMAITCSSCHFAAGSTPSWATQPTTTDETFYNNLCTSCHLPTKMSDSRYIVKTHSSQNTSGKFGSWTVECRTCHNPHLQDQVSSYPTDSTANLVSGTVGTYTQPALTATMTTLPIVGNITGNWTDFTLVPNIVYPTKMFRILSNTGNTITVSGVVNYRYAPSGSQFAIRFGQFVKGQIITPSGSLASVKFFTKDSSKPNSYASSTDPGNVTGICQVCHTQTSSFNNMSLGTGSIQENPNHPSVIAVGGVCTDCHIHTEGFKGGCAACHGYPPNSNATLVFKDKNNNDITSDSTTKAGAHVKHVDSVKLVCSNCHSTGMLSGAAAGDSKINIGFNWNGDTSGIYDGNTRTVYPYTGASTGGTNRCTNIYCHSSGQGSTANNATPVYATPKWDDPASGACGTCHQTKAGVPLGAISSGSHTVHLGAAGVNGCGDCHAGAANDASSYDSTNHVNKLIEVANGYTAAGAAGNGYGTCSAAACHVSAYGVSSVVTPTWGNTAGCGSCHPIAADGAPATGSHALHIDTVGTLCADCHTGAVKDVSGGADHLDTNIDVTKGYPANVAKHAAGAGYSSCSTAVCHGAGSPTWGNNTNDAQCVKCHGVSGTSPAAYSSNPDTAAPGYNGTGRDTAGQTGTVTSNVSNDNQVGAHDTHLRGLGGFKTGGIACNDCHAVTSLTDAGHMNGTATMSWSTLATKGGTLTPNLSGGNCSNVYCHGASFVNTQGTGTIPSWTDGAYLANAASAMNSTDCNMCHQSPAFANSNYNHSGVTLAAGACNACHQHDGSGALHIDGVLQAAGGACNTCHDYDVDAVTGDWGKSLKAVEGWGAHATHISHLKTLSGATLSAATDTFGGAAYNQVCGVCHTKLTANHTMGGGPRSVNFGDGSLAYQFSTSGTPTYTGVAGVSSATTAKTCSNVSCHFQASPVWQGL